MNLLGDSLNELLELESGNFCDKLRDQLKDFMTEKFYEKYEHMNYFAELDVSESLRHEINTSIGYINIQWGKNERTI